MSDIIDKSDSYCIVGAGPAGLIAARALRAAGIAYEQFERNPDVGGIWDIRNDWTPMYESAHFISSKTQSAIPGFPMPVHYPDYPSHRQIFAYMQSFARAYDLYAGIRFQTSISRIERDGQLWTVQLDSGETRRYAGLFLCSGNTWDPNIPEYPGVFAGEIMHSVRYKTTDLFRGKRVLIVGAGNSGCDIACDAAANADTASISMRRGYHFIPKYILGQPADVFANKVHLPRAVERPIFEGLLRLIVGKLESYGLPTPDHRVLESHPIVNTQILHYLGHGDIDCKPDIQKLAGKTVHFVDGTRADYDLIVYATGYKVTYPYMDRDHFKWISKYPDLYLSGIHRVYDNVCCLGLHQTDGGAFDLFATQADMMANFISDERAGRQRAQEFRKQKRSDYPDLRGGVRFIQSPRHATYVRRREFLSYCDAVFAKYKWTRFSLTTRIGASRSAAQQPSSKRKRAIL